jgi:hypothetical protein
MAIYIVSSTHKVMTTLIIVMFGLIWLELTLQVPWMHECVIVKFSLQLIICIILFYRLQNSFWRTPKFLVESLEGPSVLNCGNMELGGAPNFQH